MCEIGMYLCTLYTGMVLVERTATEKFLRPAVGSRARLQRIGRYYSGYPVPWHRLLSIVYHESTKIHIHIVSHRTYLYSFPVQTLLPYPLCLALCTAVCIPCSRCLGGGKQCTYSKRRWHQPPPQQASRDPQRAAPAGMDGEDELLPSASGAHLAYGMLSFKR